MIGHHAGMTEAWVYMLASRRNGTLYVGVTKDLRRRIHEHRTGSISGFSKRYGVKMLVWYEKHETWYAAIQREKNIKHYPRRWKIALIEAANPLWRDLYEDLNR